jgi:hypothetical protein
MRLRIDKTYNMRLAQVEYLIFSETDFQNVLARMNQYEFKRFIDEAQESYNTPNMPEAVNDR